MRDTGPETQTPYDALGGAPGVGKIVDRFYALMDSAPEFASLRRLHAPDLSPTRALLFEFLSSWLGGPPLYFQRPEHRCVMSAHRRIPIGAAQVEQWLGCMNRALAECAVDDALCKVISPAMARLASGMRNRGDEASGARATARPE